MKKVLFALITSILLFSCGTTNEVSQNEEPNSFTYNIPVGKEFELEKGVGATIKSYKAGLKQVKYNGKFFSPLNSDYRIFQVSIEVTNKNESGLKTIPYKKLELITGGENGKLSFVSFTQPNNSSSYLNFEKLTAADKKDALAAGKSLTDTIFFIYQKDQTPAAISLERVPVLTVYKTSTPDAELIDSNIAKLPYIYECFAMIKNSTAEEIAGFMEKYGITYEEKDRNGLSFAVHAIINKNNAFFDKTLENCDLTSTVSIGSSGQVDLLGLAAMEMNKYACDKLIARGFTFESSKEKENPAVVAVRKGDLKVLRFIVEILNVDVSDLKIPMAWSGAKDAETYCRDRKRTEMADYLASRKK
ncbi:MAG: hypothetical protein IKS30_02175 [Treponema sp.]|nr:hypothetical protein [Treponema sp.]